MLFLIRNVKNILTALFFGTLKLFMMYKLMVIDSNHSKNSTSKTLITLIFCKTISSKKQNLRFMKVLILYMFHYYKTCFLLDTSRKIH